MNKSPAKPLDSSIKQKEQQEQYMNDKLKSMTIESPNVSVQHIPIPNTPSNTPNTTGVPNLQDLKAKYAS